MKYLKKFNTENDRSAYENGESYIEPYVSYVDGGDVHYNKKPLNYLRFTALQNNSSLELKKFDEDNWEEITPTANVEYSTDGFNWTTWDYSAIVLNQGETVYIRGNNPSGFSTINYEDDYTVHFFSTPNGSFECHGNIMSLLYGSNFEDALTIPNAFCFDYLFCNEDTEIGCNITTAPELPATALTSGCYNSMFARCTGLTTAPELPATTLTSGCYYEMFLNCTSLVSAPELPAETLANNCYYNMFNGCTSLTTAPDLPATTLANYCYFGMFNSCTSLTTAPELLAETLTSFCYNNMFKGCTALTTAPDLPATALEEYCYGYMFDGCTSLTTAPELPATTLTKTCYESMFQGCTSLVNAPALPATTLVTNCYYQMFKGCTNLNYIKAMFTTTPSTSYTNNWVSGVSATGTFVKNASATWTTTGVNGVPNGWTVETASA